MNDLDKSEHPRDERERFTYSDGMGGEHIPTQAEKERLREMGIDNKPQLNRQEYGALRAEVMRKNAAQKGKVKPIDNAFTANYFYVYSTNGDDDFEPIIQLDIEQDHDEIEYYLTK